MKKLHFIKLSLAASVFASGAAIANEDTESKIANLESQIAALREDVKSNNLDTVNKWHMAGYSNVDFVGGSDRQEDGFTSARFAPIFHYQFSDRVLFEGELEVNTNADGETEIAAEYATIDLMLNDYMALVAGKFLSPIGQFRQNVHPSWINKLPTVPVGFGEGGAAPLADLGVQLRGGFPLSGSMRANYALYTSNGPTLVVDPADGEVELESEPAAGNADGNFVYGGRVGFLPVPALELGLSGAFGKMGVGQGSVSELAQGEPDRDYTVLGADAIYNIATLQLRGEFIQQTVGSEANSTILGGAAAEELEYTAWYGQAAYRVPDTKWEGVVRLGDLDTPDADANRSQWSAGVNYLFTNNVIIKAAYTVDDYDDNATDDDKRFNVQLAYGF
ncbi:porin [Marinobacter sp. SS8-8]|uniref:porin n=1 Tax=Marinobacter sp. SS8-8 TaxID=3050452 RepID=UPI0026DFB425|nr:porin [Marinobacter sp. SS8-8]|tara:strand:- start:1495 stop:2667 length:1173 start_codon:yes stop_codon:yes gene_type:complete